MDNMNEFLRLFGRGSKGKQILEMYVGYQKYKMAWETPVGKEIMTDLMERLTSLASKIEERSVSGDEEVEYLMLKRYADQIADKINGYLKMKDQIEKKLKRG